MACVECAPSAAQHPGGGSEKLSEGPRRHFYNDEPEQFDAVLTDAKETTMTTDTEAVAVAQAAARATRLKMPRSAPSPSTCPRPNFKTSAGALPPHNGPRKRPSWTIRRGSRSR